MLNTSTAMARQADFVASYAPAGRDGRAVVLNFVGNSLLVTDDNALPGAELTAPLGRCREALTLGALDGVPCEMRVWPGDAAIPPGLKKSGYRQLWGHGPDALLEAVSRGQQLAAWLDGHRFCGACGGSMTTLDNEPARRCERCGALAYPRLSPVCIVLVLRGDEMLLARSPHFPPGVYSALAGYIEAGESVENCLRREVREEAGIGIANIRWFGSQSWPYPHSLMLGFLADYADGELTPQPEEIEDAGWFTRDRLPALPHPSSIARRMIDSLLA